MNESRVVNPFPSEGAARRYAAGRPDYAPLAGAIISRLIGGERPLHQALDVGCGTGISTAATRNVAAHVIAVDSALPMLQRARSLSDVWYVAASAEELPFADKMFDLITVGSALHWFNRERFLAEGGRVGQDEAWLVVHDHWFSGRMEDHPELATWAREKYLVRYPTPKRHKSWQPPEDLDGWHHVAWERYEHSVEMTLEQFVTYLTTQSNVHAVIEEGVETESQTRTWLQTQLKRFFNGRAPNTLVFGGYVACHRR